MPEPKDVIIGILGASGALAGLLLIFGGFVFSQAASFPAETTDNKIIRRYTTAAKLVVWPFLGLLLDTILAVIWLLRPSVCMFWICVSLFLLLVVGTGVYGAVASFRYLGKG